MINVGLLTDEKNIHERITIRTPFIRYNHQNLFTDMEKNEVTMFSIP